MKKRIILLTTISILVILTGCNSVSDKQTTYLINSDNYLFNKDYVISETKPEKPIKGLQSYKSYVKSLNDKSYEITNIGIFAFKNKKSLKNFSNSFIKELDSTINQIKNNKAIIFNKKKIDEKTYLYTSIYQKEQELSTVVLDIKYDTLCFVVITGVGRAEKEDLLNPIARKLAKQSEDTLLAFNKSHKRKKDYLTNQEKTLFSKLKPSLESRGFEVNIDTTFNKKNYEIKVSGTKQNSSKKELYSIEVFLTNNTNQNNKSYIERENTINAEIKNNKALKQEKQSLTIKQYAGFTYKTQASNGEMITKYLKSNDNKILIKLDYSILNSKTNKSIDNELNKVLYSIT